MTNIRFAGVALGGVLMLASCSDEAEVPVETDQSATATGDVLGGTISDDMLPLEELRSQSPSAPRAVTRKTVSETTPDGGTTVETTVTTTSGEAGPPPPAPPAPPASDPGT